MVSLLTVTYNSSSTITDCLLSLNRQTFNDLEVIVVDNSSRDHTRELITSLRSRLSVTLKTVWLNTNMGFTGGNNTALQYASGEYIALLNPDAFPEPTWLEHLVTVMEQHPEVGICASQLLRQGLNVIDSAGDIFSTSFKAFKRSEGSPKDSYSKTEYVFGACAGAALYRKRMLDEIGFFDEDFFLMYEDADLNFRANLAGWKVMFVPHAVVHHHVSSSIGKMSNLQIYHNLRNTEYVRIKNLPLKTFLKHFHVFVLGAIAEFLYFGILHLRLRLYLRAKLEAIRQLPKMYAKRKAIMQKRTVDNTYIESLLTSVFEKDLLTNKLRRMLFD